MPLLATPELLRQRALVVGAGGPLSPLARSLAGELAPVVDRDLYVPSEKALLSRTGGRCPVDAVNLDFDPLSPEAHRCPVCGVEYGGELHHRFWIYWYQLWLAERAVHAALLAALGTGPRFATFAGRVLEAYAEQYLEYPDRDNVLGPTRVFFSTYLESIWLLNLCIATDVLEQHDSAYSGLAQRVRDRIVEPSRALIASYDEGDSNRQVWNNAALFAAARLLGKDAEAEAVVHARSGLLHHLSTGLLADGTWYEGENYHLFAHRGLWYGVTMAELAGLVLPESLATRFQEGFATPFLTALPDFTLPSRRDSQYAISLRQWRFAELCELGLGRLVPRIDERLAGALRTLYQNDQPRGDTGRARSSADVERNVPPALLSRADLGWRSLLHARAELPPLPDGSPRTVLLEAQGLAVLRRAAGRVYVALDYGTSGGGHGHPDRLNLLLYDGSTRWLDDMGTGSYVDPSLHWYRSTLAHNAPLFGGRSQRPVNGVLAAFEERGTEGWISASAHQLARGINATRTVVVMRDYLIDELSWTTGAEASRLELPFHLDARIDSVMSQAGNERSMEWLPATLDGSDGLEDGFRFVSDASRLAIPPHAVVTYRALRDGRTLRGWTTVSLAAEWYRASAPGAPGSGRAPFMLWRVDAEPPRDGGSVVRGTLRTVLAWADEITAVDAGRVLIVWRADGSSEVHEHRDTSWTIASNAAGTSSRIELAAIVAAAPVKDLPAPRVPIATAPDHRLAAGHPVDVELGEPHYRRSEESWAEAGRPSASIRVARRGAELTIEIEVRKQGPLTFARADAENLLDNEHLDINGDGVQLYVEDPRGRSGWILVPDLDSTSGAVRTRMLDGWSTPRVVRARWERTQQGYRMRVRVEVPELSADRQVGLDVLINEKPPGRDRRRGQLVLSGAAGEFVYLRGDRHDPERLLRLRIEG